MQQSKAKPMPTLLDGGREALERELVSLACTGSTEQLEAAVARLTHRAKLHVQLGAPDAHCAAGEQPCAGLGDDVHGGGPASTG